MKKLLTIIIAMLLPILVSAQDSGVVEIDGIYYLLDETDKTAVVTFREYGESGSIISGYSGNIIIPSEVTYNNQNYNVTAISAGAFWGSTGLTSVFISNSVTNIGYKAFYDCFDLTSITIPSSVTEIGEEAFYGCSSLTYIHISDIETWFKIAFEYKPFFYKHHIILNGEEIRDLVIPNSITSICDHAFYMCTGLTSVKISNSVTEIGEEAFFGCSNLTSVNIPNSVISIGEGSFSHCCALTSITIPPSVTSMGDKAFLECTGLTSVIIPSGLTSISNQAFANCSSLTSITIPNSITSIGTFAFYGCSGLTSFIIPNNVTSIGGYAFNCTNLMSITSNITEPYSIPSDVFSTETYRQGTLYIPAGTEKLYTRFDGWSEFLNIMEIGSISNIRGDLNNDGKVDAADIVELVNIIMGK